ncbi:hypothetical protein OH76DRAFT_1491696, partial [Lentinus brumalis]
KKAGDQGAEGQQEEARPVLDLAQDESIEAGVFPFKPYKLASLVDPKNMDLLKEMGGVTGLLKGLGTSRKRGLGKKWLGPSAPVSQPQHGKSDTGAGEDRRVYSANILPTRKTKSLLQLMWLALKDKVLVLLSIAAVVSLALGFFQDFSTLRPAGEPPVDWVEGVAIMVAIIIVVMIGSLNDWQERQFQALNEKKEERGVKVIRDGVQMVIDIKEVVIGDVALVEPGEIIPCDGVFLSGHNVKCDESGATGESDAITKMSYEDCLKDGSHRGETGKHTDCFMISGSKVLEGYGSYVVMAVGTRSFNGRIMMALQGDIENTPLQLKLNNLAELIAKLGSAAGLILFTALMIRFFWTPSQWGIAFVQILIISVTLIIVAVPEGLPLAVTLALAFTTKRMRKENLLVRVPGSRETTANAPVTRTDKTGTSTQNDATVTAGWTGTHRKLVHRLEENMMRTNAEEEAGVRGAEAVDTREIHELAHVNLSRTIIFYANQTLRTIAVCYRDFESWLPPCLQADAEDEVRI